MPSIDKLRHNIRHAVSLSAFSPNLIHRIRYFFSLYSYFPRLLTLKLLPDQTFLFRLPQKEVVAPNLRIIPPDFQIALPAHS